LLHLVLFPPPHLNLSLLSLSLSQSLSDEFTYNALERSGVCSRWFPSAEVTSLCAHFITGEKTARLGGGCVPLPAPSVLPVASAGSGPQGLPALRSLGGPQAGTSSLQMTLSSLWWSHQEAEVPPALRPATVRRNLWFCTVLPAPCPCLSGSLMSGDS
jgi:hypothetical protein